MTRPPPSFTRPDTIFPYTTLFRSQLPQLHRVAGAVGGPGRPGEPGVGPIERKLIHLTQRQRLRRFRPESLQQRRRTGLVRTVAVQHDPFAVLAAEGEALDVRDHRFAPAGHLHQHGSVARLPSGSLRFLLALLADGLVQRSEEHTSELQSLMRISYAVFCLKKKKNKT